MAQRPTMHDVAAAAGVSQAVVSLVLSGSSAGRASETTAQRVRDAAAELGYRTNLQAKSLKTGVTEIIGLVGDEVATSPFSGMMIKGAQDRAWQDQHTLMTVDTGGDDDLERAAIETMLSHRVRGIIYTAMYHREVTVPAAALDTHVVCLNARDLDGRAPSVIPDEVTGGVRGHPQLFSTPATPASPWSTSTTRCLQPEVDVRIRSGHCSRWASRWTRKWSDQGEGIQRSGFEAVRHLMALPAPPTAIFCGNDRSAPSAPIRHWPSWASTSPATSPSSASTTRICCATSSIRR